MAIPVPHLHDRRYLQCTTSTTYIHVCYTLIMDLLRLPSSLRQCLLSQLRVFPACCRPLSTKATKTNKVAKPRSHTQTQAQAPTESHLTLSSSALNEYSTSNPPNSAQLHYASNFFQQGPPNLLYSAYYFRSFPPSSHPEVAFLGRSNVGKSSILNASSVGPMNNMHMSQRSRARPAR